MIANHEEKKWRCAKVCTAKVQSFARLPFSIWKFIHDLNVTFMNTTNRPAQHLRAFEGRWPLQSFHLAGGWQLYGREKDKVQFGKQEKQKAWHTVRSRSRSTLIGNIIAHFTEIRNSAVGVSSDPHILRLVLKVRESVKLVVPARVVYTLRRVETLINVVIEVLQSSGDDCSRWISFQVEKNQKSSWWDVLLLPPAEPVAMITEPVSKSSAIDEEIEDCGRFPPA